MLNIKNTLFLASGIIIRSKILPWNYWLICLEFSLSLWSSFIVVFLAVVQVVLTKMPYIPKQIHYVTLFSFAYGAKSAFRTINSLPSLNVNCRLSNVLGLKFKLLCYPLSFLLLSFNCKFGCLFMVHSIQVSCGF